MFTFRGAGNPYMLIVGMSGVKLGDRFLQIGCSDGRALAAVAGKVGLSGHAMAVVPDAASAKRVRSGAAKHGILVDVETAPASSLPVGDAEFDLVIIDDATGLFASATSDTQIATVREAVRVLGPGGRVLVISGSPAAGLAGWLGRRASSPPFNPSHALENGGCRFVRVLGEREGLRFVEGTKARA